MANFDYKAGDADYSASPQRRVGIEGDPDYSLTILFHQHHLSVGAEVTGSQTVEVNAGSQT